MVQWVSTYRIGAGISGEGGRGKLKKVKMEAVGPSSLPPFQGTSHQCGVCVYFLRCSICLCSLWSLLKTDFRFPAPFPKVWASDSTSLSNWLEAPGVSFGEVTFWSLQVPGLGRQWPPGWMLRQRLARVHPPSPGGEAAFGFQLFKKAPLVAGLGGVSLKDGAHKRMAWGAGRAGDCHQAGSL